MEREFVPFLLHPLTIIIQLDRLISGRWDPRGPPPPILSLSDEWNARGGGGGGEGRRNRAQSTSQHWENSRLLRESLFFFFLVISKFFRSFWSKKCHLCSISYPLSLSQTTFSLTLNIFFFSFGFGYLIPFIAYNLCYHCFRVCPYSLSSRPNET